MKILIALKNDELLEKILQYQLSNYDYVIANDKEHFFAMLQENRFDRAVVHCNLFADTYPWDWMTPLIEAKLDKTLIVGDSSVYDSIMLDVVMRLATDHMFDYVPAGGSISETATLIYGGISGVNNDLKNKKTENGKCVTVFSAAPKDGATTFATNLAVSMALSSNDIRVALIDLNLKNPEIAYNLNIKTDQNQSLRIRPSLQTNVLLVNGLLDACIEYSNVKGLYILSGSSRRDTFVDVTPEMVHNLIELCKKTFDVTVIDAGSYPDNAATIVAVREADERFLVSQIHRQSFVYSWGDWFNCSWRQYGISAQDLTLVVNRDIPEEKNAKNIAKYLEVNRHCSIPNVAGGVGILANNDGKPLYFYPEAESFKKSVDEITGLVLGISGSSEASAQKSSPYFFDMFKRISAFLGVK